MPAITFPVERMTRFLNRITKGLLFTFYPEIDYSDMYFEVQQITPSQEVADFMYENMLSDERGDGGFRFWRAVVEDNHKFPGTWCYVFYDGVCFCVAHSKDKNDLTNECNSQ